MLYCIIVFKFNSNTKWFFERSTQWCRLVSDLGCIADVSEPPNPSQQFSMWFDEPYEGAHYPAEICELNWSLVEADRLCWNLSGRHLRCSRVIFSAEIRSRLSSAALSCIYLRELCWCYQLSLLYAARQCEHHHRPTDGRRKKEHTTLIHVA